MTESVKVAIIGGGPAGLGAAMALAKAGVGPICILEREEETGGAARHCGHPSFGVLPFKRLMTGPGLARTFRAKTAGLDIRTNWSVTALNPGGVLSVSTPDGDKTLTAERVIIATGARETPRAARLVSGMRPVGVTTTGALQQYVYLRKMKPFRKPVIIGSETVSFSALWTLLRHGIRPIAMVEPGKHCQFYWPSGYLPPLLGCKVYEDTALASINGIDRVESVTVRPQGGPEKTIACDGVLFTGLFTSENALIKASSLDLAENAVGPRTDQYLRCSDPAYFAAGNMLHPAAMGDLCWLEGTIAAANVIASLQDALPAQERIAVRAQSPDLTVVTPGGLVPGKDQKPVTFCVKAKPFTKGALVFRQNGREILRRYLRGHEDRFTRIRGFDPACVVPGSPLEVFFETTLV